MKMTVIFYQMKKKLQTGKILHLKGQCKRRERERELADRLANESVAFVFGKVKDRLLELQIKLPEVGKAGSHTRWKDYEHTLALMGSELQKFQGTFSDLKIDDPLYYKNFFEIILEIGY